MYRLGINHKPRATDSLLVSPSDSRRQVAPVLRKVRTRAAPQPQLQQSCREQRGCQNAQA
eukprot:scaffold14685_cov154-Isochrysis_galbana.AAC.2